MRLSLRLLIIGAAVALVAVVVVTGWALLSKQAAKKSNVVTAQIVCSDAIFKEAGPNLDAAKSQQLKPTVDKILKLPNYDHDPNCLNVVTTYYLNISDYDNAKVSFDKLQAVYDSSKGFNSNIFLYGGIYAKNIDALKDNVAFGNSFKDMVLKTAKTTPKSAE